MAGSAERRMFSAVLLRCEECRTAADEDAWGWRALRCGEPELDEVVIAFYCPVCAEMEFGFPEPRRTRREA
jgi:hypothetical protein